MKPWKNPRHWSSNQRQAVSAELEAHLTEVLNEAGQLNLAAREKLITAEDLLNRLVRHHDQGYDQEEVLPF